MQKPQLAPGLDQSVVSALTLVYLAGQRAADGHMPHLLTANGLRIAVEPSTDVVSLSYADFRCELSQAEAYELATMMTAAADTLRTLQNEESSKYSLSRPKATMQEHTVAAAI